MTLLPSHFLEKMDPAERRKLGKAGMTAEEATEKQIAKSERDLQNQIASWLSLNNIWFTRSAMNKRTTNTVGTPDFLLAVNGRAIGLEVKFGAGKLRPEQENAITAMSKNGWCVAVVRSLPEVIEFIKEVQRAA